MQKSNMSEKKPITVRTKIVCPGWGSNSRPMGESCQIEIPCLNKQYNINLYCKGQKFCILYFSNTTVYINYSFKIDLYVKKSLRNGKYPNGKSFFSPIFEICIKGDVQQKLLRMKWSNLFILYNKNMSLGSHQMPTSPQILVLIVKMIFGPISATPRPGSQSDPRRPTLLSRYYHVGYAIKLH